VPEYKWYAEQAFAAAQRVLDRFPGSIEIYFGDDADRALGVLSVYDLLLVNSLKDGMNLVAQEGPIVNSEDGVLVLSRETGCADLYEAGPLILDDPGSVEATAETMRLGLCIPSPERRARAELMRDRVKARCPAGWLKAQISDLESISAHGWPLDGPDWDVEERL
jgi:trehalose 6-phosphate synthase